MNELRLPKAVPLELLPWQAAVMVMCVTVAGFLHEHPGAMRPLASRVQAVQLRFDAGHVRPLAGVLNVPFWLGR